MEIIKEKDVKYAWCNADPVGRVFFVGSKVFRGINKDYSGLCREIFSSGLIEELLVKKLIVNTKITDYKFGDYEIIIEHEKVLVTYPSEWSFSMVKDGIITLLEINEVCNKYGFQLKDGHLWNLTFNKHLPVLLDFGSIVKYNDLTKESFKSEISISIIVLMLWSKREYFFAPKIIENGITFYKRTLPAFSIWDSNMIKNFLRDYFKLDGKEVNIKEFFLSKINLEFVKNIKLEETSTMWDSYQLDFFNDVGNYGHNRFIRFDKILNLIKKYSPDSTSILDLAGNMGAILYYIEQKYKKFGSLINVDYDENAIEKSYTFFKKIDSKIESYVLNFMLPTRIETKEIFKSDLVLALAVTHHLILTQNYKLDSILESIESYSNKYVYIEFMPLGLYGGDENITPPIPDWYNIDWFRSIFIKKFDIIHEEQLEKNRIIFIGIKKSI